LKKHLAQHPQAGRLGYVLKRAQHALRTGMDNKLHPLGITTSQYNVLAAIERDPGISNADLARGGFITAQSMVGIVANLERMGLIQRHDHPQHGRVRRTELTSKGRSALQKAHKLLSGVEDAMTLGFSSREREELGKLLSRCTDNLIHHFR
jgi:DNA-binding MarR family transcriptional regulator